jgi:hypothetical protein
MVPPVLLPLVPVVLLQQQLLRWLLPQLYKVLLLQLLLLLLHVQRVMLQAQCRLLLHQAAPAPSSLQSTTCHCADGSRNCCWTISSRTHQGSVRCTAATAKIRMQQHDVPRAAHAWPTHTLVCTKLH